MMLCPASRITSGRWVSTPASVFESRLHKETLTKSKFENDRSEILSLHILFSWSTPHLSVRVLISKIQKVSFVHTTPKVPIREPQQPQQ
jgi:hypothetical protein